MSQFSTASIKRLCLWLAVLILSLIVLLGIAYEIWLRQIHPVIPNRIYRSAQLSAPRLRHYIDQDHIKTVINLRGAHTKATWYQEELAVTNNAGIDHYDIALSSHQVPSKEKLRTLVYLLMNAPKPILIHCLSGADRTGLASAMSLILEKNAPLIETNKQFSIRHLVISPTSIGKQVFPYYETWLSENHTVPNRDNFLKWVCSPHPFHGSDLTPMSPQPQDPCLYFNKLAKTEG